MAPVSEMPHVKLMLGGFPLHLLQIFLVCVNVSSTLVLSLLIDLLLLVFPILDPNFHATSGRPLCCCPSCLSMLPCHCDLLPCVYSLTLGA